MKYFEDIHVGEKSDFGSRTLTAAEIKTFARQYDPQPFHLDEEAATRSHYGALCASGWHTASLWMRACADYRTQEEEAQHARGEPVPPRGPSPGFRDLRWPKPVYAGDTLRFASEVVDKRPVRSRPGWGLVFCQNTGTNQKGELVLSFASPIFVARRPA